MIKKSFFVCLMLLIPFAVSQEVVTAKSISRPYVSLVIGESGGYVMPQYNFTRLPRIVLYSDGRMYTRSDVATQQYPGPAVQTIMQKSAAGSVANIMKAITKAKLTDPKFDWGVPGVADVSNTDIYSKASANAKAKRVSVYAIEFTNPNLTKKQSAARKNASKLITDLQNFSNKYVYTKSLPTPWVSNRWAYQVNEGVQNDYTTIKDWVGEELTGVVKCAVLDASASGKLVALLPEINQETLFSSGGKLWKVSLRPLFPHETGCKSLGY